MSTEHWCNDNVKAKLKYWEINLPQCNSALHKSHTDFPGIKAGIPE
jgi:hypothetical protein